MTEGIMTVDELLTINSIMLGRGVPNQDDGIGYNKADYSICSNYYYGLSNAQIADLSKRLVKYAKTQLHLDKKMMEATAEYYKSKANIEERINGISVHITEKGTVVGFRYNEKFVNVLKNQPKRRYDNEMKQWIVPNQHALKVLQDLKQVGGDVENAMQYVKSHELFKKDKIIVEVEESMNKVKVSVSFYNGDALLRFNYNKNIVEKIKALEYSQRKYNPDRKYWSVKVTCLEELKKELRNIADFIEI